MATEKLVKVKVIKPYQDIGKNFMFYKNEESEVIKIQLGTISM